MNPFNKRPHTAQYRKILEVRKKLPVYAQMTEFYEMVSVLPRSDVRGGGQNLLQSPSRRLATKLTSWKVHQTPDNRHGWRDRVWENYSVGHMLAHGPNQELTTSKDTSVRVLLRSPSCQGKARGMYATSEGGGHVRGQACCR